MADQQLPNAATPLQKLALLPAVFMLVALVFGVKHFLNYEPIGSGLAWAGAILAVAVFVLTGPWFEAPATSTTVKALRVAGGVSVATVALIIAGLFAGYIGDGTDPPPASITDPIAQAAEVMKYAQGLSYSDSHHGMDEQWLEVSDSVTRQVESLLGPRARIFPEVNSHKNNVRALMGIGAKHGRIVAKIEVEPDARRQGIGYRKLGLPAGTSYLWIDSLSRIPGVADSAPMRALIFSAAGAMRVPSRPGVPNAFYRRYPKDWANYAQARWRFHLNDPCMCEGCSSHGWCDICGEQ